MKKRILLIFITILGLSLFITLLAGAKQADVDVLPQNESSLLHSPSINFLDNHHNSAPINATAAFTPTWWTSGPVGAAVKSIAVDPVISNTLYLATYGAGIYRSMDGGITWDDAPNDPIHGINLGYRMRFVQDVATAEGVVYATTSGLSWFHRSTDGGTNWSHVSSSPGWANDIAVDPNITSTLYVANSSIYSSTNAGDTWFLTGTGLDSNEWITEIAINPSTPSTMYASSGRGKVYKSINGGSLWSNSSSGLPGNIVWSIAINRENTNIIYAGLESEGVWRSENAGVNWTKWSGTDICPYVREIVVDPVNCVFR